MASPGAEKTRGGRRNPRQVSSVFKEKPPPPAQEEEGEGAHPIKRGGGDERHTGLVRLVACLSLKPEKTECTSRADLMGVNHIKKKKKLATGGYVLSRRKHRPVAGLPSRVRPRRKRKKLPVFEKGTRAKPPAEK